MGEPWYESECVSMETGKTAILNNWFCKEMRAGQNTFESNQQLATSILELNDNGGFSNNKGLFVIGKDNTDSSPMRPVSRSPRDEATMLRIAASNATRVTFEMLRRNCPHWETVLERIIVEELQREHAKFNGLGSVRGFYTFVFKIVSNMVLARAVVEMWAIPTLSRSLRTYARSWVEHKFAPDGQGFKESAAHFEKMSAFAHTNSGSSKGVAHIGFGGCLDMA